MAKYLDIRGTSRPQFSIGKPTIGSLTLDVSSLTSPYTWLLPDSSGISGNSLLTDGNGNLYWGNATAEFVGALDYITTPLTIPVHRQYLLVTEMTVVDTELTVEGLLCIL